MILSPYFDSNILKKSETLVFREKKIRRNIERDNEVNIFLISQGWTVLRFWTTEIRKELPRVLCAIENMIENKKQL